MDSENNDLGLDQPLKLGRVSRIAKLTDELLFETHRGLPQVRNNYPKLVRAMRKNDLAYASKVLKKQVSRPAAHQLKVSSEVENLQKVLLFYQLWCHGLFPKATFQDCLQMLRGHKSVAMREYRRGLLNNEIRRLKVEKGIIVEDPENEPGASDDEFYDPASNGVEPPLEERANPDSNQVRSSHTHDNVGGSTHENADESDDDDWGILSAKRSRNSALFIADDDDDDDVPASARPPKPQEQGVPNRADPEGVPDEAGLERFPDEAELEGYPDEADLHGDAVPDEHDEELAIMREMGM